MIIFNTDLDNTIIYSYKHNIGADKRNVEIYNGREISFITNETLRLLNEIKKHVMLVPTTTRSIEQYRRINLGLGMDKYALVCNGGILLYNGKSDENWYRESLKLVEGCKTTIKDAVHMLEMETHRYFEVRHIEKLFLFTKCTEPELVVQDLLGALDNKLVDVFNNGDKVYVVPKILSKGNAINRLREMLHPQRVIAAGDSEFDISMVISADAGIVPKGFKEKFGLLNDSVYEVSGSALFSEEVLHMCLDKIAHYY